MQLVVFVLSGQRYAVELDRVERVLRMVAITPLPAAPAIVTGVFVLQGELVPVAAIRRRFRLPERTARPSDQLLVVRTARRRIALPVDGVESVDTAAEAAITDPMAGTERLPGIRGVVRLGDGLVFIHDLDAFLSVDEEQTLAAALAGPPA